jgi:hypothetical protein
MVRTRGRCPPKTTFYRRVEQVAAGKHTFGSACTQRSRAERPGGPFSGVSALRPGEPMQVDSTPFDVRVVLDNGPTVELTWLIDLATRSVTAAVLRPRTKAVAAALLLARTLTPEPMRQGWTDAFRMSRSVLPYRRLVELDRTLPPPDHPLANSCNSTRMSASNMPVAVQRKIGRTEAVRRVFDGHVRMPHLMRMVQRGA